jgi:conjugal transfer pilus assembly protein TraD
VAVQEYEPIRRPNYELGALLVWLSAAVGVYLLYERLDLPLFIFEVMGVVCGAMMLFRGLTALGRWRKERRLKGGRALAEQVSWQEIRQLACRPGWRQWWRGSRAWLGIGFAWGQKEIQKATEIMNEPPKYFQTSEGRWIHGLGERNNRDLWIPAKDLKGHTLIVGSTGTGKTRLFDLLIAQAIFRNEPVIVIDPKGDRDLSKRMGAPTCFLFFHPMRSAKSVRLDPMKNFHRYTELASRVAALIPSETKNDPWWAFGWKVLESVIGGMEYVGCKPNLVEVRRYVESGVDDMAWTALKKYFAENWPEVRLKPKLDEVIKQYNDYAPRKSELAVQGLNTLYKHNRDHFQKMVASLIPILTMLTAGDLRFLLSPQPDDGDSRPAMDMASVIEKKAVLYVGLDSLPDAAIGSAIGSILVAELAAVASAREPEREGEYVDERNLPPVNIFIDEAAEVVNDPAVQLLNKSRSFGFRLAIATQTLADLMVRTGTAAGARQVIGNTNNWIIFRVIDGETQKYIAEALPKTVVRSLDKGYRSGTRTENPLEFHAMYTETVRERPAELFPPSLLGGLPDLHFFAKFANATTWKGRLPIIEY